MVSIIIPVYQVSDYIERCICSVMAQIYPDIECVIVDDATHDDSVDKIEHILNNYNGSIHFSILHHDANRGLSAARNTGTKAANGEFIFYLDSDDEIPPNCIQDLLAIATGHPDAEMVLGNFMRHTIDGESISYQENIPDSCLSNYDVFSCFEKNLMPDFAWNKLIRRSFLTDNNFFFVEGILWEDMPWMFFLLKKLSKLYFCNAVTYHYHIRPNSIVTGTDNLIIGKNYCTIYDIILHNLTTGRENRELNYYVDRFCKRYLEHRREIPEYKALMKDYRLLARKFENSGVVHKLDLARMISLSPIGVTMLQKGWMKIHGRRHFKKTNTNARSQQD